MTNQLISLILCLWTPFVYGKTKSAPAVSEELPSDFKIDAKFKKANTIDFKTLYKKANAGKLSRPNPKAKVSKKKMSNKIGKYPAKLEIIFDSSGSMGQMIDAFQTRMYAAKKVVAKFLIDQWKKRELVGLRVYGSKRRNDCKDTELAIPFGESSIDNIEKKISFMLPIGRTPLLKSVKLAIDDLKDYPGPKGIVVFTDGKETCGGDLCKFAKMLKEQKEIDIKIFTVGIGFNLKEKKYDEINCLNGLGGDASSAQSEDELFEALGKASDSIQKDNNLRVISPDPKSQVNLYKVVNGKRKLVTSFTAAWGIRVPPGVYYAEVMTRPSYTFPKFTIPEKEKVTLEMRGDGKVKINFAKRLLNVEFLDENGKVVKSTKSGETTTLKMGVYKVKSLRPPFFEQLLPEIHVYPGGKYTLQVPKARSVLFKHPTVEGFYVYDNNKEMIGNYLTNTPVVLPEGQFHFYLNKDCYIKSVKTGANMVTPIVTCADAKKAKKSED